MGLPLALYFLCLYYFGPAVASTYWPWVCFFSLSGSIQARLLPQDPLYEPVSHSFLPLALNGFFSLANFDLPVLLGFFLLLDLSKWTSTITRFHVWILLFCVLKFPHIISFFLFFFLFLRNSSHKFLNSLKYLYHLVK